MELTLQQISPDKVMISKIDYKFIIYDQVENKSSFQYTTGVHHYEGTTINTMRPHYQVTIN